MAQAIPVAAGKFLHKYTKSLHHFILHIFMYWPIVYIVLMKHQRACGLFVFLQQNKTIDDLTILRLPPALLVVWAEAGDDILDTVTDGVVHRIVWSARITLETFLLLLHKVIYWKP